MANIVLKCPVCESTLTDDICPQCGYVHLYFPASVPKAIDDFQKRRVEVLKEVVKRHSDQVDDAKGETSTAYRQVEKLRMDLGRVNDIVKDLNDKLDTSNRKSNDSLRDLQHKLDDAESNLRSKESELKRTKRQLLEAERKAMDPKLPFNFTVSQEKDFIGMLDVRGERVGLGISRSSNGEVYMGDWKLDMKTGVGMQTEQNGQKYAGQFRMNRAHGVGIMVNSDGSEYAGEWKNGKKTGGGMTVKPNGEKMFARYDGHIVNNAAGAYFLQDGSIVCGCMTDTGPNGKCIRYLPDGSIEYERWINGVKQ